MPVLIAVIFPPAFRGEDPGNSTIQFMVDGPTSELIQKELSNPDLRFLTIPRPNGESLSINLSVCRGVRFIPQPDESQKGADIHDHETPTQRAGRVRGEKEAGGDDEDDAPTPYNDGDSPNPDGD